jgi:hypothetical protein
MISAPQSYGDRGYGNKSLTPKSGTIFAASDPMWSMLEDGRIKNKHGTVMRRTGQGWKTVKP